MVVVIVTLVGSTLSLFTFSGDASRITLVIGANISDGFMVQNILARRRNAEVCSIPIVLYRAAGAGFSRAWMRYRSAWAAASIDDMNSVPQ